MNHLCIDAVLPVILSSIVPFYINFFCSSEVETSIGQSSGHSLGDITELQIVARKGQSQVSYIITADVGVPTVAPHGVGHNLTKTSCVGKLRVQHHKISERFSLTFRRFISNPRLACVGALAISV